MFKYSEDYHYDDEIRLVRLLLSNTKLRVNVNGTMSVEFQSFLGAFQGDCLSGCLFTLVLAGALCDLRVRLDVEIDRLTRQLLTSDFPWILSMLMMSTSMMKRKTI